MSTMLKRLTCLSVATLVAVLVSACQTVSQNTGTSPQGTNAQVGIDAAPVQQGENAWKIASADTVTLTVSAPGAQSVRILYRPIVETDRHILLKTLNDPTDGRSGNFLATVKLVPDFAGDVWAEVSYSDGTKKETEPIELAAQDSAVAQTEANTANPAANKNGSARNGESARSDKFTGGKIEQGLLQPGQPDIKITVNVPAFRLTLWQNGKEVRTYEIGVGMKKYPIVIGQRRGKQVI